MPQLTVATCQFPVSADVGANLRQITRQMSVAAELATFTAHLRPLVEAGLGESRKAVAYLTARDSMADLAEE